jgi:ADP-ribose pyrophosphatase YjhB (NUDIX family)
MEIPLRVRLAGRVIVLDPGDRVLLFRYDDSPPNGRHWATPGGGLDDGESFADGARRELTEETGWTDVVVGEEVVLDRTLTMGYGDEVVRQHERFFLARVDAPRRELGSVEAMHVSDGIKAWRWWTLDELDATADDPTADDAASERVWPEGLAGLVRSLVR